MGNLGSIPNSVYKQAQSIQFIPPTWNIPYLFNSNAITLFISFPPICSILVFIPLPRCPIYLPGFMSHLRLLIPILLSLHSQFLSLLLVLIQALFSLLWLHANLPALLLYLSLSPTCSQSQSPLFNLSVFSSQCHFPLSFSFSA